MITDKIQKNYNKWHLHIKASHDEYDRLTNQILSLIYTKKSRNEIQDFFVDQIINYYGTPDLNVLEEPYKSKYYSDLETLLEKLEVEIHKTNG